MEIAGSTLPSTISEKQISDSHEPYWAKDESNGSKKRANLKRANALLEQSFEPKITK